MIENVFFNKEFTISIGVFKEISRKKGLNPAALYLKKTINGIRYI